MTGRFLLLLLLGLYSCICEIFLQSIKIAEIVSEIKRTTAELLLLLNLKNYQLILDFYLTFSIFSYCFYIPQSGYRFNYNSVKFGIIKGKNFIRRKVIIL